MPDSVKDFFESDLPNIDPSKLAGMTNTYAFDIDGAGQWTVAIADGDRLSSRPRKPSTTRRCSRCCGRTHGTASSST